MLIYPIKTSIKSVYDVALLISITIARFLQSMNTEIIHAVNVVIMVFAGKSVMLIEPAVLRYSSLRDFAVKSITRIN